MAILNSFPSNGKDISSATVNLVSTSFTYDGQVKIQNINSVTYGGNTLEYGEDYVISGDSAVNAGTHTLKVIGINEYSGEKSVNWSIAKGQGSISAESSVEIVGLAGDTAQIMPTVVGDGSISASSSNTNIATVSVSDGVVTITSVGEGNTTITITLGVGMNYIGSSCSVSVDITIYPALENATPAQIQQAVRAGIASSIWAVGDRTAEISIGAMPHMDATSCCAFILGFNHNSTYEGTGIQFQLGKTTSGTDIALVDEHYDYPCTFNFPWYAMNESQTNSGGWESSKMRTTTCATFLTKLPSAWQDVIVSTYKYTDNRGGIDELEGIAYRVTYTSDKLFLLAEYEVIGTRVCANYYEDNKQEQYDYYKNGNSRIKYKHNSTSTACDWWLRSPSIQDTVSFCGIYSGNGRATDYAATYGYGFAPGFRIA